MVADCIDVLIDPTTDTGDVLIDPTTDTGHNCLLRHVEIISFDEDVNEKKTFDLPLQQDNTKHETAVPAR